MYAFNNKILDSFSEINRAIYKLTKLEADRVGVTVVQLKTLYRLSSNPNISLGELADKLKLTNSTVSGVIDRLVHSGLVERAIPPENRRAISIHLTEQGKNLLDQFFTTDTIFLKKMNELLEIPEEEIAHLLRLHKLVLSKLTIEEE
ncbi:MAG: MarR family winged helix-turn-helix transcriptional regulator [Neobacillus sp.]|jgi:MarR family transcriptional regulator, organic hydroperoxide resistance regulator